MIEEEFGNYSRPLSIATGVLYCVALAATIAAISLLALVGSIELFWPAAERHHLLGLWFMAQPIQIVFSATSFYVYRDWFRFIHAPARKAALFLGNAVAILTGMIGIGLLLL